MLSHSDTIPERDEQTDRHNSYINIARQLWQKKSSTTFQMLAVDVASITYTQSPVRSSRMHCSAWLVDEA